MRDSSRSYLEELHIKSCIENDGQSGKKTGFDEYYLINESLPDISFDEVDTTCTFLNKIISAPFSISPMTGGIKAALSISPGILSTPAYFIHSPGCEAQMRNLVNVFNQPLKIGQK